MSFHRNASTALILAALLTTALAACDMVSGRQTAGQYVDDTAISARVKSDLMRTRTMKPFQQIHVTTFNGQVTLSGEVDSRKTADRAMAIAQKVPTVLGVKDEMDIRGQAPSGARPQAQGYDNSRDDSRAAPDMRPPITGTGYNTGVDGTYVSPYHDSSPGNAGPASDTRARPVVGQGD